MLGWAALGAGLGLPQAGQERMEEGPVPRGHLLLGGGAVVVLLQHLGRHFSDPGLAGDVAAALLAVLRQLLPVGHVGVVVHLLVADGGQELVPCRAASSVSDFPDLKVKALVSSSEPRKELVGVRTL